MNLPAAIRQGLASRLLPVTCFPWIWVGYLWPRYDAESARLWLQLYFRASDSGHTFVLPSGNCFVPAARGLIPGTSRRSQSGGCALFQSNNASLKSCVRLARSSQPGCPWRSGYIWGEELLPQIANTTSISYVSLCMPIVCCVPALNLGVATQQRSASAARTVSHPPRHVALPSFSSLVFSERRWPGALQH